MRTFMLLALSVGLIAGCGGSRTRDNSSVPEGAVCQSSAQCAIDFACLGCANEDAHCIAGCESDSDCSEGHCEKQTCITCPCPGRCEQ
ncbi:hypothetical protein [Pyxidicoccus sp. MSG2]|uniref:hypothetical protein n=1 Tax=Pyxidicoccus sp. MSG2 TaxID=2996790 RepID=UPI0022702160|nr:hypothetical protein [Pyxidicoccus sp. MSG2]MCY1014785.1 hypothetical protein [Pyxidicoccus sp. MSG2]